MTADPGLLAAAVGALGAVAIIGVAAALVVPARTPGRHRPGNIHPVGAEWLLPAGWLAHAGDHIAAGSPLDELWPTVVLPVLVEPAPHADPALRDADALAAAS